MGQVKNDPDIIYLMTFSSIQLNVWTSDLSKAISG